MPYALLSVSDKRGLVPFARGLVELGYTLLASGGTARVLQEAGLPVRPVSTVTGFPEILGGRVKTLHPAIHGGILSRRTPADQAELERHGIPTIDVVAVNLYPFEATVRRKGVTLDEALENIDIGGVALLRAAAKNFPHVLVLTQPEDYEPVLRALREGRVDMTLRRQLAVKAFAHTAAYDTAIANYLAQRDEDEAWPERVLIDLTRVQVLRYGENPHQRAALYRPREATGAFRQLHGKAMSYNNWLDLDAAWRASRDFDAPAVVIVKHGNPCGIGLGSSVADAYRRALASDPVSAFGSVIAVRGVVDDAAAEAMRDLFIEVLAADGFTDAALERLKRKSKNLRLLLPEQDALPPWDARTTVAGWLLQTPDIAAEDPASWRVVTQREPTALEWEGLVFAWRAVKHVKSNAIVLAREVDGAWATVGVGAGQMSRVDAVHLAVHKAGERARGAVLASDAFFPFPDGVEVAAQAGVTAIIQPGGSKRDAEVIAAADRLGLAMIFTGRRHFRH
ncbi:MAG: bifunctional phosphoribosylaminoimidazolecarboxamide formyltransferase/IMP cyclohydrolase [Chloroflexi bacterium]|nr:bifunctional phosphoribosylaminoimidazolecarboxamide formyltransferase/IMP cyclohydrolase [Chloroflexota bacterium]